MECRSRRQSGKPKSKRLYRQRRSSGFPVFPFLLRTPCGASFFDEAGNIGLGIAMQIASGTIFGSFAQGFHDLLRFKFAQGFAEDFTHGAAFLFGDGFGASGEVGGQADGEDAGFAGLGGFLWR